MKIVTINGQNHKGTTYHFGRMLAEKIGGEITEFFLPKDFDKFCVGCGNCFMKDEKICPHYNLLEPITKAMDEADVLIFTSPVYVFHTSGQMKALLDHYGHRWMIHRPNEKMFSKQAICISTAAGMGIRSANKDIADSMFFWGVPKIYKVGMPVFAIKYSGISDKTKQKIDKKTTVLAKKIKNRVGKVKPNIKTKALFYIMRIANIKNWNEADSLYWKEKGWTEKARPWK